MSSICFSQLPQVSFLGKNERHSFILSLPDNRQVIDGLIGILRAIGTDFLEDHARNKHLVTVPRDSNFNPHAFDRYKTREIWRVGSYIVFACDLDGIVHKTHEELLDFLGDITPDVCEMYGEVHRKKIPQIRDGLKEIRKLRNKIFAHTAFAEPYKEDTQEVRKQSMRVVSGYSCVELTDKGLIFETLPGGPAVSVPKLSEIMQTYLESWHALFLELISAVAKTPLEKIRENKPTFHGIRIYPPFEDVP